MVSKQSIRRSITLLLPFILILSLYGWLRGGISIDSFSVGGFRVEKLYLKLDKKLILEAKSIRIPRDKKSPRLEGAGGGLDRLHALLGFFDKIELDDVVFNNDHYRFLYADHIIYITSREYELAGMVYNRGKRMEMRFPLFYIKKYQATFSGTLSYRYHGGDFHISGTYTLPDIGGTFRVDSRGGRLKFRLSSAEAASLDRLIPVFSMRGMAREWLESRVHARRYRLEYLIGEGDFDPGSGFRPDFKTFQGGVDLQEVKIRFHDRLFPIVAPHARILLKNGGLYFDLDEPSYDGKSLKGSRAALLYLAEPGRLTLLLRLKYQGRLDWNMLRILHVYGVPLKLGQKSGSVITRVDLDIPLENGSLRLRGIGRISPGILEAEGREFRTDGGVMAFTSKTVELRHVSVTDRRGEAFLSGKLRLKERKGDLRLEIRKFRLGDSVSLLEIHGQTIPIRVSWDKKEKHLNIPKMSSEIIYREKKGIVWKVKDLEKWKPWLKGPFALFTGGSFVWRNPGGKSMRMEGKLRWPGSPLYGKKGSLTSVPFVLETQEDLVTLSAFDDRLRFHSGKQTLDISGINIDGEKLMAALRKIGGTDKVRQRLKVTGKKSMIRYGPYVLLSDIYRLDLNGEKLSFVGTLGKDRITLDKNGKKLRIRAKRIGDRMLHALIHFNGLQEGRYTLDLKGEVGGTYTGMITIEGGVLRDVQAYNDLIALINTVPALMAFSSPGFSRKGFEIEWGKIVFRLKGDLLTLSSMLLKGKSATVAGRGTVNLKSRALNIELAIRTAREMGKVIGHIPVVGYILFGKDQSLTAGVRIEGTIEKPKVRTNPVGQALLYPLQILKRTLMAPASLAAPATPSPLAEVPAPKETNTTKSRVRPAGQKEESGDIY